MADPSFDAVYVGSGYDASVTVPGGLSASHLVAFVAAFGDSTSSITMSGWTQQDIAGAANGGDTVRQAVFTRAYASGTYSPTLGGPLSGYLMTIYAVNDVDSIGADASNTAAGENPVTFSVSPTIANNNALVLACATCWGDSPDASDLSGTWSSNLGPPTLAPPSDSEQRTWYATRNSGTLSFSITKTSTNPDTGVCTVIILEGPSSTAELASSSGTATLSASASLAVASELASTGSASFSASAALSAVADVSSSGVATFSANADLSTGTDLSANGNASWAASAELSITSNLTASGSVDFAATSTLGAFADCASSGIASFAASAALSVANIKIFVMGNSLAIGTWNGGTSTYALTRSAGLQALRPDAEYIFYAANGYTTAGLIAGYAANILPHFDAGARNLILFWETVNSLLVPTTPAAELAQIEAFAADAKADGFEFITATILPIGVTAEDNDAQAYNGLARSSTAFDGLVDLRAGLPQFSPVASNPLYDTDYDAHLSDGASGGYAVSTEYWDTWIGWYLDGVDLGASGSAGLSASASLAVASELASVGSVAFDATGALSASVDASASGTVAFAASATVDAVSELISTSGAATLSAGATLDLISDLAASEAASFSTSADLSTTNNIDIQASGQLGLSCSAVLDAICDLSSTAQLALSATGVADAYTDANAIGAISVNASADLSTTDYADLAAAGATAMSATGALELLVELAGNGVTLFGSAAEISIFSNLESSGSFGWSASATLDSGSQLDTIKRLAWTHVNGTDLRDTTWTQSQ